MFYSYLHLFFVFQRLSVQEVPPLLNGDSSRSQQQQRPLPSSSQSDTLPPQGSPQTFRSAPSTGGAAGGSSRGASPQHTSASVSPLPDSSTGSSASPATSTPTTSSGSAQQGSLLLSTNTYNLSPSLIPSTVMSLSQISPAGSSLHGMTLPIPHSAPHSPPLPHSAPLSRAMTPVQLLHQQVGPAGSNTSSPSHNPWLLKAGDMCATATLPLPRRPVSEMRLGGFQGNMWHSMPILFVCMCVCVCVSVCVCVCITNPLSSFSSSVSIQAQVSPGCCRYLDLHVWKPCLPTVPEHQRLVEEGAGLAYCTSCLVTTSPCSSLSPETDGTTVKTNGLDGTCLQITHWCRLTAENHKTSAV